MPKKNSTSWAANEYLTRGALRKGHRFFPYIRVSSIIVEGSLVSPSHQVNHPPFTKLKKTSLPEEGGGGFT